MREIHLGQIVHLIDNPYQAPDAWVHFKEGALIIEDGHISWCGEKSDIPSALKEKSQLFDHGHKILLPGFIDCHVHYPQLEMTASYGTQLLEWLKTYTFPTEDKFSDYDYAHKVSEEFLASLMNNGTTTALVFGTVHAASVSAFFDAALNKNMRMIAGKVMMDRNAPDYLCQEAQSCYEDCKELIEQWHGKARLNYAVTPRFAPTSSPEQLRLAAQLLRDYDGLYVHTHLSENLDEIKWVSELFPDSKSYTDVYQDFGLCTDKTIFAHGIHLSDDELTILKEHQCSCAFCPSSNLFIGSGLFPYKRFLNSNVNVGLGSDIGGGNHMNLMKNAENAYKIMQLQGENLPIEQALYLATLGAAKTLSLDHLIGNFAIGNEADFIVIDPAATAMTALRTSHSDNIKDVLFATFMLGDDRHIHNAYIMGKPLKNLD